jgi:phage replication O-like protein O
MANPQKENGFTPISNELLEALARTKINSEARQVFDAIIRKTFGFKKKSDAISVAQLSVITGLPRRYVFRGIKRLKEQNLIHSVKSDTREVATYSIQKDYEKWCSKTHSVKSDTIVSNLVTASVKNVHNLVSNLTPTKEIKKTKEMRARAFNNNNYSIINEIQTFIKLKWEPQKIKNHFLMREIPEASIDQALGKEF